MSLEVVLLLTLLALAFAAPEPMVSIDGATWAALTASPPVPVVPGARVESRDVALAWDGTAIVVRARWILRSDRPDWHLLRLFGPGVHVDEVRWGGRRAAVYAESGSWAAGPVAGLVIVEAVGTLLADPTRGAVSLDIGGATAGVVRATAPAGLVARVEAQGAVASEGRLITGAERLSLTVGPPRRAVGSRGTIVLGATGLGLTVGDGAVEGRARVGFIVRQGQIDRVAFTARHVGDDLRVEGPQVASWRRSGDRVEVTLREPTKVGASLDLAWSSPLPATAEATLPLPELVPLDVVRAESSAQLARDGEIEVVPGLRGWEAVSSSDLPEIGLGLVQGAPTAAFVAGAAGRPGSLALLRYVPAEQPAVMVDVASTIIAVSQDGRAISRTLLTARNERAAALRVRPPAGAALLAVRVAGEPVAVARADGALRIPLPRSLETVEGLVSFPIELTMLIEGEPWERREQRELPLLAVEAPIAVSRATVHLPPGFRSRAVVGEDGLVDDFTEGETLAYGFGLGDAREEQADELWQEALQSYMRNDFDQADALLGEIEALGASNENLSKLKGNLDVVQGRRADAARDVQARRVVAQASSRGLDDRLAQEEALVAAEKELQAGNYAVAERMYERAEVLSSKLGKLEQAESVEQAKKRDVARDKQAEARAAREQRASSRAAETITFDDAEIDGELMLPDGWFMGATGVEGGVLGGVVGGVLGGRAGGAVATEEPPSEGPSFIPDDDEIAHLWSDVPLAGGESGDGVGDGEVVGAAAGLGRVDLPDRTVSLSIDDAKAAPAPEPSDPVTGTFAQDFSRNVPMARSYESSVETVEIQSLGRAGGARGSGRGPAGAAPSSVRIGSKSPVSRQKRPPEPAPASDSPAFDEDLAQQAPPPPPVDPYALEALQVTSTAQSVVIPVLGETLRFQHLLLPAGASHAVQIDAVTPRKTPWSSP